MNTQQQFIENFANWAKTQGNILGVFLVGSYARNSAKDNSDIDFVVITENLGILLNNYAWTKQFGSVADTKKEDYGLVQSLRVFYKDGIEAEFGITTSKWLKTNPVDSGTQKVLLGGYKILFDKDDLLNKFISTLK